MLPMVAIVVDGDAVNSAFRTSPTCACAASYPQRPGLPTELASSPQRRNNRRRARFQDLRGGPFAAVRTKGDCIMARYGKKAQSKVEKTMRERKRGTLRSGRSGKKVTSRKQAIAIGLSEARRAGGKVPKRRSSSSKRGS